jgi:hypothetical protein
MNALNKNERWTNYFSYAEKKFSSNSTGDLIEYIDCTLKYDCALGYTGEKIAKILHHIGDYGLYVYPIVDGRGIHFDYSE